MFEPSYNRGIYARNNPIYSSVTRWNIVFLLALLAYKIGDFQDAYTKVSKALQAYPNHSDSLELKRQLEQFLTMI